MSRDGGLNARRAAGESPSPSDDHLHSYSGDGSDICLRREQSCRHGEHHDVQARGFRQPSRQQAPHASPAEPGVHASAAAELPHQGKKAIEKIARNQPAAYLKILALLVPRGHKVEHSNTLKNLSDEQLEAMIAYIACRAG